MRIVARVAALQQASGLVDVTQVRIDSGIAYIGIRPHGPFTAPALPLHYSCTAPALLLHCPCTTPALLLHCPCTAPALLLHCPCTAAALLPHCCLTAASLRSTAAVLPPLLPPLLPPQVHIDGCIYVGPASLRFAQQIVELGGQVLPPLSCYRPLAATAP